MDVARTDPIIVWGPGGSGASLYLTALACWQAADRQGLRLALLPVTEESAHWVTSRATPTADGLDVGPRSPSPARAHDFRIYGLPSPNASTARSAPVGTLRGWSGIAEDPGAPVPAALRADLHRARGVVVLVGDDPVAGHSALQRTTALLDERVDGSRVPVAACLTMTDRALDAARRDAARWLAERDADGARALADRGAHGAVFKVSALGHAPRVHGDREILHVTPEARGVLDPIRWILEAEAAA